VNEKIARPTPAPKQIPYKPVTSPVSHGGLRDQLKGIGYNDGMAMVSPGGPQSGSGPAKGAPTEAPDKFEGATLWAKDAKGKDLAPAPEDVTQGTLGDCYLMSAMAGLANTRPQKLQSAITDKGGDKYEVEFAGIGKFLGFGTATQTVTAAFEHGKHAYMGPRNALWPLVIEKAYAAEKGGIEKIAHGGDPAKATHALTDESVSGFDPRKTDPDEILVKIEKGKARKSVMTCYGREKEGASDEKKKIADGSGLYFNHAYTIMDVDRKGRSIKLRNPWGHSHPYGTGWLPVDEFKAFFIQTDISSGV